MAIMLKECRKKNNMSQAELGEKIGVDRATIRNWETGKTDMPARMIEKVAAALNTSVASLMGEHDEQPQEIQSNVRLIPQGNILLIPVISPEVKVCAGNGTDYRDSDFEWTVIEHAPIADGELSALYSAENLLGTQHLLNNPLVVRDSISSFCFRFRIGSG